MRSAPKLPEVLLDHSNHKDELGAETSAAPTSFMSHRPVCAQNYTFKFSSVRLSNSLSVVHVCRQICSFQGFDKLLETRHVISVLARNLNSPLEDKLGLQVSS